jgi:sigma54-dependent transcription regulator
MRKKKKRRACLLCQKRFFSHFSARKGDPDYQPTSKELAALRKLVADGFSLEQIIAGIETAFERPNKPRFFTHCAAITRDLARCQQENPTPETRNQPEAHRTALTPADKSQSEAVQEEMPAE